MHYWEPSRPERAWDPGGVDLGPPLSVEQLLADAKNAGVDRIVQITPSLMGWDNRYAIEGAERHPDGVAAVIGRFDPLAPELPRRLAAFKAQPRVAGVRIMLTKGSSAWLREGRLEELFAESAKLDLPVLLYGPNQAAEMKTAALRHPQTTFLIDHMAVTRDDNAPFARWNEVARMAEAPNVYMKVSYFPEAAKTPYPFANTLFYFQRLYERFGPDRLIWGSNYPVSAQACTYKENVDYIRESIAFLSEVDKEKILGANVLRALGVA
ncbi:MAG: amidohydrolase family protein [Candidatus Eremiobacteraeota bacterium]|nr:amidohydrolase family protein [Candidatus Eremiobacteraeota bacterium]